MERNNGGHKETTCICPNCKGVYVVQHGGQKSGGSPAVHVPLAGGPAIGYCSIRCKFEANNWSLEDTRKWYSSMEMDYDKIFPPGYLAPSRTPRVLIQNPELETFKSNSAKRNGRG